MGVARIPDAELWQQHTHARRQMLELIRKRTACQLTRTGAGPAEISVAARGLDPHAFTIGFARRFATYKRATLIFRDQERLKRILNDPDRPVQIIFAGKAHPSDEPARRSSSKSINSAISRASPDASCSSKSTTPISGARWCQGSIFG